MRRYWWMKGMVLLSFLAGERIGAGEQRKKKAAQASRPSGLVAKIHGNGIATAIIVKDCGLRADRAVVV
jgi:hypothetical protein